MAAMKYPWFQMFSGDWLKDPQLGRCDERTRGIWMDVICVMREEGGTGVLVGTLEQLARLCRTIPEKMRSAIEDLRETGAADVAEARGRIILTNRRMKRDYEESREQTKRQQKYRSRKSADGCHALVTPDVMPVSRSCHAECHASVTLESQTESESESDIKSGEILSPPTPSLADANEGARERATIPSKPPAKPQEPPEYWPGLLYAARQAGMRFADGQLARLKQTFARLPTEERRKAIEGIELRLQTGEYANGFVPMLKRYLNERLWTAELRAPPKRAGPAEIRKQAAREEFHRRMREDYAELRKLQPA